MSSGPGGGRGVDTSRARCERLLELVELLYMAGADVPPCWCRGHVPCAVLGLGLESTAAKPG